MKRVLFLSFSLFLLVSATVFAADSSVVFKPEYFSDATTMITNSLGSVGSLALEMFSVIFSLKIAFTVIRAVLARKHRINTALEKRHFDREINRIDVEHNGTEIIEDKILRREVDLTADYNFTERNWSALVDKGVQRRKMSRLVKERDVNENFSDLRLEAVRDKVFSLYINHHMRTKNRSLLIEDGVERKELQHDIDMEYLHRHPNDEAAKRDAYKRANDAYYSRRRLPPGKE